jgi:hypothetical protein
MRTTTTGFAGGRTIVIWQYLSNLSGLYKFDKFPKIAQFVRCHPVQVGCKLFALYHQSMSDRFTAEATCS